MRRVTLLCSLSLTIPVVTGCGAASPIARRLLSGPHSAPVAPAAPSGSSNAGGRRGRNIVSAPTSNPTPVTSSASPTPQPISISTTTDPNPNAPSPSANTNLNPGSPHTNSHSNMPAFKETRSDAQRNKMTNQGTQNLLG
ncbi:hypothetical protein EON65_37980 [archaeon]|nr:MAG: hypothetical protein EON65_37980 [archaeon]